MNKTPDCPHCGHGEAYEIRTRNTLRCKQCLRHFSLKSASRYRSAKVSLKTIDAIRKQIAGMGKLNIAEIGRTHSLSYRGAYYLVKRILKEDESQQ